MERWPTGGSARGSYAPGHTLEMEGCGVVVVVRAVCGWMLAFFFFFFLVLFAALLKPLERTSGVGVL